MLERSKTHLILPLEGEACPELAEGEKGEGGDIQDFRYMINDFALGSL